MSPPPSSSHVRKRPRSVSTSSTDTISTISTGRSVSPKRARRDSGERYYTSQQEYQDLPRYPSRERKRRRKSSSSVSEPRSDFPSSEENRKRNGRRRRRTLSPEPRGRPRTDRRGSHRSRSRSRSLSVDQGRIARGRKSMTPVPVTMHRTGYEPTGRGQENRPFGSVRGDGDRLALPNDHRRPGRRDMPAQKERSLSPYSKRIALTQAMNMER